MIRVFSVSLIAILVVFISACSSKPKDKYEGYSEFNSNLYFKLISFEDSLIDIEPSQALLLELTCKTQSGAILVDSKGTKSFIVKDIFDGKNDFYNQLYSNHLGDSLSYNLSTKLFNEVFKDSSKQELIKNDSIVKLNLKIKRIASDSEFVYASSFWTSAVYGKQYERQLIDNFVKNNFNSKDNVKANGLVFELMNNSKDTTLPRLGKKINIIYKGFFLDGRLVDFVDASKPFEFKMGEQQQLLPGITQAITLMKKGEKAKIVLPSHLAFGEQGSSSGLIPKFTPLYYELEIIDIKK